MRSVKVLSCVAAMALVALVAAPVAEAQCAPSRIFASAQQGTAKALYGQVAVNPAPVTPVGDEIGRFWQSSNANLANNFSGGCPAPSFWKPVTAGGGTVGTLAIQGEIGGVGCAANACPDVNGDMTVVVEDWAATNPPPGVGGTAYFVAWRVTGTPTLLRTWDYARTGPTGSIYPFLPFPDAFVTSSGRNGMNVDVTMNYADVAPNFHGATGGTVAPGAVGTPLPAQGTIVSYDLMLFVGLADPGRDRTLWTPLESIPYPGAGITGTFESVACPDTVNNALIAVGVSFDGGAAGPIASRLVGRATALECDPNLAEPQPTDVRPKVKQAETRRPTRR